MGGKTSKLQRKNVEDRKILGKWIEIRQKKLHLSKKILKRKAIELSETCIEEEEARAKFKGSMSWVK